MIINLNKIKIFEKIYQKWKYKYLTKYTIDKIYFLNFYLC